MYQQNRLSPSSNKKEPIWVMPSQIHQFTFPMFRAYQIIPRTHLCSCSKMKRDNVITYLFTKRHVFCTHKWRQCNWLVSLIAKDTVCIHEVHGRLVVSVVKRHRCVIFQATVRSDIYIWQVSLGASAWGKSRGSNKSSATGTNLDTRAPTLLDCFPDAIFTTDVDKVEWHDVVLLDLPHYSYSLPTLWLRSVYVNKK